MSTPHQSNVPRGSQAAFPSPQHIWRALHHWFRVNTFAPAWLGKRWNHPLVGIIVALLAQVIVLTLKLALVQIFPAATLYIAFSLLCIAIIALSWGAGPSVVSIVFGALLYATIVIPEETAQQANDSVGNAIGIVTYMLAGCAVSALASQTERARRTAQTLASSLDRERARLETILETIPDAVALYDAQGKLLWLNRMGQPLVGAASIHQTVEEMPEFYAMRTPSGDPLPLEETPLRRALHGETISGAEIRYRGAQDKDRLVSVSAAPLRDSQGRVDGALVVSHDVSMLRQAESDAAQRATELQATTNLLEAVIEAITDGVFVYDATGHTRQINSAARAFLKMYAPHDNNSLPLLERAGQIEARDEQGEIIAPEQYPSIRVLRGEVLNGANSVDMVMRTVDGSKLQLNLSGAPIKDASGQQTGAVIVGRDVTERRRLERRTQEALEALLLMAQTLVQVPPVAEPAHNSAEAARPNEAAQRLVELTRRVLGCQRVSIVAVDLESRQQRPIATIGLTPAEEARWWAEQGQVPFGGGRDPSVAPRLLAGEIIIINTTDPPYKDYTNPYGVQTLLAAPIRLGERLVGILGLDYGGATHSFTKEELALAGAVSQLGALVLERERLLHERAEGQAQMLALQETNQLMDEFLSIISHELRTPVTSIKTGMQLMLRRITNRPVEDDTDPEKLLTMLHEQGRSLQRANIQMRRLTRLLDDLIDVSRISMEKIDIHTLPCDLSALVREVVEDEQSNHPDRVISLEEDSDTPVQVQADPNRIGQVLTNFLTNALKYSLAERPVQVGLTIQGPQARVWVRDQGPGIPLEEQGHIWEIFHRVPGIEVKSGSGVGLGLGLHISKVMIEEQRGTVGVESAPGQGSTFWFALPLLGPEATTP